MAVARCVLPTPLGPRPHWGQALLRNQSTKGALETFLLEAIAEQDEYDKEIIKKGEVFVDNIDPEQRYLKKRRYATKAKFDVYFSIRTPIDQFIERRNILKDVQWENYVLIQQDFNKLSEL